MKDNLKQRIALLENELSKQTRSGQITQVLFKISNTINMAASLDELFISIHADLGSIIDTTNFYIALYDQTKDTVIYPYCVDSIDGSYPPIIGVSRSSSLTAAVIRSGCPLMATKEDISNLCVQSGLTLPAGTLKNLAWCALESG